MTDARPTQPRLILASQSPRRAQLLRDAGLVFEQVSPPFADPDQPEDRSLNAEQHAMELARAKAASLARTLSSPALILAADTLCVDHHNRLVGKPRDRDHARAMLRGFANRDHAVVTGVAIQVAGPGQFRAGETRAFTDRAVVSFGEVSAQTIEAYLDLDQWRGKAGGYNLFDRQAAGWPIRVAGDPTTVVGLPMQRLLPIITEVFAKLSPPPVH
ncbi:MAG: Maf family protein [Planctomycetota bacterium]